jgi:hypothetical protein
MDCRISFPHDLQRKYPDVFFPERCAMDNLDNGLNNNEKLVNILKDLEDVRDKLVEVNKMTGALAQYESMKQEILVIGWNGVCSKYHPDINIGDPAAHELFAMYRFVYDALSRDQRKSS